MNPLDIEQAVNRFIQWDVDRIAALITGLLIGALFGWWLLRHMRAEAKELREENSKLSMQATSQAKEFREEISKLSMQATSQGMQLMACLEKLYALQETLANLKLSAQPKVAELEKALRDIQDQLRRTEPPIEKPLPPAEEPTSMPALFEMQAAGAAATARVFGGQFIVLKGSTAKKKTNEGWNPDLRDRFVDEGKLAESGQEGYLVFTEDVPFNSPSQAAGMVYGGNQAGPRVWRIKGTQRTYQQWLDDNQSD